MTHPFSTAKFPSFAGSTLHPANCTVYIMHSTCTCKCTGNCICTLHTTHWTLCITHHTFIMHAAHLSLHTVTSKICRTDTQDLHGKMNPNTNMYCFGAFTYSSLEKYLWVYFLPTSMFTLTSWFSFLLPRAGKHTFLEKGYKTRPRYSVPMFWL